MTRPVFSQTICFRSSWWRKRSRLVSVADGCRSLFRFFLLLVFLFGGWPAARVVAQDPPDDPPAEYTQATGLLQAGDTAGALALLRVVTRQDSLFGPAFLKLGTVATALLDGGGAEHPDTALVSEARWSLRRARELMGPQPEVPEFPWDTVGHPG